MGAFPLHTHGDIPKVEMFPSGVCLVRREGRWVALVLTPATQTFTHSSTGHCPPGTWLQSLPKEPESSSCLNFDYIRP